MTARHLVLIAACVISGGVAGGNDVERIAILGCLRQNEPAPALEKCLEAKPDLCLWIGDNVYADTATSPDVIRDCYATLAAKPGFAALRAAAPWVATWDDHDFGCNDGGGGYPVKRESRDLFREFWRLEREIPADRDGVYFATTFPAARRRLFEVIRRSAAEHLVFLTGDQHYGEVCRLPDALGYDTVELQFSGVNQIEAPEFNSTRVAPHAGHAHNDYWHDRPLLDAVDRGFASVEADVFLRDGDLLVGHAPGELRPGRTLAALYLEPIRSRLEANGCVRSGMSPFTLLVDIKADGPGAYRALARQLKPLRRFLVGDASRPAALRVIVSGDRPIDDMAADPERLAGVDGRLEDLDRDDRPATLVPLVSDRWGKRFTWYGDGPMPDGERADLRRLVATAHARGQAVRFWGTPDTAAFWEELLAAGVDLIGCDDLDAFVEFAAVAGSRP